MADIAKLVEELSKLTVMEAAELSKALEEEWGVSAAAPVAVAGQALVEGAPKPIKEGVNKAEAEEIKAKIEAAGGTVELK